MGEINKGFTVADGLQVQQEQLLQWALVLKPDFYIELCRFFNDNNKKLTDQHTGYDVPRGTDIDHVINNYMLSKDFAKLEWCIRIRKIS